MNLWRLSCNVRFAAAVGLALTLLLAGCEADGRKPGMPDATGGPALDAFRNSLQDQDAGYRVGLVTEVLPAEPFASVGRIPTDEFEGGEVITFLDPMTRQAIATGEVIRVLDEALYVEFDARPGTFGRRPAPGDWAFHRFD